MRDKEITGLYQAYLDVYSNLNEEVENWVNALVEDGYDLSEYTWDDMTEMYMNETRRDPRGRPASGPMSVYGGRGEPSPDPEGDDNISRMDRAQRRVKRTKPRAQGMAADALFTKYSARQSGMEHGGEEGPGPKAPRRGGRSGRGANTDRGSGNAAKRRMSEDFELFDYLLEHLVAEGYADTNESALAIMANMSEGWREEIMEGMTMKDFKANRQKNKRREASADAKKRGHVGKEWYNSGRTYSPDEAKSRRANMSDDDRAARHRAAVDPDDDRDTNYYSADKTKNPNKLRKQMAMGERG